jgi:hypothetical protein
VVNYGVRFAQPDARYTLSSHIVRVVTDPGELLSATPESTYPISGFRRAVRDATRSKPLRGSEGIRQAVLDRTPPRIFDDRLKDPWENKLSLVESDIRFFLDKFKNRDFDKTSTDDIRNYCSLRDAMAAFPSEESLSLIETAAAHFCHSPLPSIRKALERVRATCEERPVSPSISTSPYGIGR